MLIMVSFLLIMHLINLKLDLKEIYILIKITGMLILISLTIIMLCFFVYLFFMIFVQIYTLLKFLLTLVVPVKVGIYLAFVITFIIYGYFPEKFGYYLLKVFEKIEGDNRNVFSEGYKRVIRFLRPKLWLYCIAFALTVVASVEKIMDVSLVNYSIWVENKDYIFEAVVTFLAFDSFISLLQSQYEKITGEVLSIAKYIKDAINDMKKDNTSDAKPHE
jgi:hypothetical protein